MALKFTVHVVQSFIKGHRKLGVILIKHSRDITNPFSLLRVHGIMFVTVPVSSIRVCRCILSGIQKLRSEDLLSHQFLGRHK